MKIDHSPLKLIVMGYETWHEGIKTGFGHSCKSDHLKENDKKNKKKPDTKKSVPKKRKKEKEKSS